MERCFEIGCHIGKIQKLEDKVIRSLWDNEKEEWNFSAVDVVAVFTESINPRRYWSDLKRKMKTEEGADQLYEKIVQLKMEYIDGKKYSTDAWQDHGVKEGQEYAILTNEISRAWSGLTTRQYKDFKGLKKDNLRDNMSNLELVLNMLAEATTTELTKTSHPEGLEENKETARKGGRIAGNARRGIEAETGKPVISPKNAVDFSRLIEGVTKDVSADTSNDHGQDDENRGK